MTAATDERPDLRSAEIRLAELSPDERDAALEGLDPLALEHNWRFKGRIDQLEATDSTSPTIVFIGGRGAGKSRCGSEWVKDKIERNPQPGKKLRFALVSRTTADVRDTIIQGDSGLMSVFPPNKKPAYIGHLRLLRFYDGSEALSFSSQEPDQLRGPQFHAGLADELGAWDWKKDDSGLTSWDNLQIATRLGDSPQIFASTTPRRVPAIRALYDRAARGEGVQLITGASTFDNPYLSAVYLQTMLGLYEGTRLSSQELYGLLIGDVEGALWKLEDIELRRVDKAPLDLPLIVVGVDPSVSEKPRDECGIVVAAATGNKSPMQRHAYVLADRSVQGPPKVWAKAVVDTAREFRASVVAERNQGGALIAEAIHTIDPTIRVRTVHARQGKLLRAEPVVLAHDQGRVHHVGIHARLEDQCLVAGTLVRTTRGEVPIESVVPGDLVLTRNGFAPVEIAAQTGVTEELVVVTHAVGSVVCTPWHPIYLPDRGEFVPAQSVQRLDHLLAAPKWENTDPPSHGVEGGSIAWRAGTIGTRKENYSIGLFGKRILDQFQRGTSSITKTTIQEIIGSRICASSPPWSMHKNTSTSEGVAAGVQSRINLKERKSSNGGQSMKAAMLSVTSVGRSSNQEICGHAGVRLSVSYSTAVTNTQRLRVQPTTPVFNLKIADGYLPEFYADGVLVHNCTSWVPEDSVSPDRLDAMVYALSALIMPSSYKSGLGIYSVKAARGAINLGSRIAPRRATW